VTEFDPGLREGQVITNDDLQGIFKCSGQGGMRRSRRTNSLVLVSKGSAGTYYDRWEGQVFHYTGMGLLGDQDLSYAQNRTLAESDTNGVAVFLFENPSPDQYVFVGPARLGGSPYSERQPDVDDNDRLVWVFPLKVGQRAARPQLELSATAGLPVATSRRTSRWRRIVSWLRGLLKTQRRG